MKQTIIYHVSDVTVNWPKDFHFTMKTQFEEPGYSCHRICRTGASSWVHDKHDTLSFCHHKDLGKHQMVVRSSPDPNMRCVQVGSLLIQLSGRLLKYICNQIFRTSLIRTRSSCLKSKASQIFGPFD